MTAATSLYTGCQWLTIVFLSRFASAELLGNYALALAIVMPVMAVTNLQLRYLLCTDAKHDFSFASYLFLRIATVTVSIGAICLWSINHTFTVLFVTIALAIGKGIEALCDILHGFLQANERMDRIAMSLMLQGPLQLTLFCVVTVISRNLVFGIFAAAAVSLAILLCFDVRSVRLVRRAAGMRENTAQLRALLKPSWAKIRKLMWLGAPMGLVMGMNSLVGNVPRYLLAAQSRSLVGIFAALFYLTLPGGILVTAYCDSACAELARWGAERNFRKLCERLVLLALAAAVIGAGGWSVAYFAGRPILLLCYGAQYAAHANSLVWLMAGAGLFYISTVLGYAVTALREFHLQVPFRAIHLLAVYIVCVALIPKEGLLGAAKAILFSSIMLAVAMMVLFLIVLRKKARPLAPALSPDCATSPVALSVFDS